jgi:hypothetical protein
MLVGAMNPCPCGWYGDTQHECTCSPAVVSHYQKRLSGPLLDRTPALRAGANVGLGEIRKFCPVAEAGHSLLRTAGMRRASMRGIMLRATLILPAPKPRSTMLF